MIENIEDFNNYVSEIGDDELFIHIITLDYKLHCAENKISLICIKHIKSKYTYFISINHPDSVISEDIKIKCLTFLLECNNIKWVIDKKSFIQYLDCKNVKDINLLHYLKDNKILHIDEYSTSAHEFIYGKYNDIEKVNQSIPILKHLELFENIWADVKSIINTYIVNNAYDSINDVIIPTLSKVENNGIYIDKELYYNQYKKYPKDNLIYSEYNLYTSTGRPSNKFNNINFSALNHSDGTRDKFISRYGDNGKMVMMDYNAFHPRLICYLIDYKLDVSIDIYEYLAKLYLQKQIVTQDEIKEAKIITFRQLFGGIEDKYSYIKYFLNLKTYVFNQWELFQKNKYVLTPLFNRKITDKHILDPNPYKLFNYILQAFEGEVAISRLKYAQDYLQLNKKLSKCVLYTYDSILIDFYMADGNDTIEKISSIMSFNNTFPIKIYEGNSYGNLQLKY